MVTNLHDKMNVGSATYEVDGGFGRFNQESNCVSFLLFSMYEAKFSFRQDEKVVGFLSHLDRSIEVDGCP